MISYYRNNFQCLKRENGHNRTVIISDYICRLRKSYIKLRTQEVVIMSQNSSSRPEVPEARNALDRFKFEVAQEIGVPLKQGYNGDLTSRQNGSVGGEMVRRMIKRQEEQMSGQA